jgi:hypothetical protein
MTHVKMQNFFFLNHKGTHVYHCVFEGLWHRWLKFCVIARLTVSSWMVMHRRCLRTAYAVVLLGWRHLRGLWQYVRSTGAQVRRMAHDSAQRADERNKWIHC